MGQKSSAPCLVPLAPDAAWVEGLRARLPEPPRVHRQRLQAAWGVSDHDMQSILNAGAVELIEATISTLREELDTEVSWVAAIHNDHTPQRHIHALVIARARLLPAPLLIQTATQLCHEQRTERDLLYEQEREQEQGKEGHVWERERSK